MSTSSTTTTAGYTLWIEWNEQIESDSTWSYAPVIWATSSQSRYSTNISSHWLLELDGSTIDSGTESTLSYQSGGNSTKGPVAVDSYMRRTVTRQYGTTQTLRLYEYFNDWYAGSYGYPTIPIDKTITVPARPYDLPATPTGFSATRVNDSQVTLAWTRNATSSAPYDGIYVERSDNGGAFAQIASVAGTATGYSDTTTAGGGAYVYRIRAYNTSGNGAYTANSSTVYTTPVAPGTPTASKQDATTAFVSWTNTSATASTTVVQRREDGGAWADYATVSLPAVSYTDTSATGYTTLEYRVANVAGGLRSAYSAASNAIIALQPPNPPTILNNANEPAPAGGSYRMRWQHNPVDGSSQSAYQYRTSTNGGGTWTTGAKTTSANQYSDFSLAGYSDGTTVTWQVRTWGADNDPSDWSSSGTFRVITAPVVAITAPADLSTLTSLPLTVTWTWTDPNYVQAGATVLLEGSGGDTFTRSIVGTATSVTLTGWVAVNGTTYDVTVTGTSASTLTATDTVNITVSYNAPAMPDATITETGAKAQSIHVAEGVPSGSELPTDSMALYRVENGERILLADGLADGDSVTDLLPPLDVAYTYELEAISSLGFTTTAIISCYLRSEGWHVWNWGTGYAQAAKLRLQSTRNIVYGDDSELWWGAGAAKPVLLTGTARAKTSTVTGVVYNKAQAYTLHEFGDTWKRPSWHRGPNGEKSLVWARVTADLESGAFRETFTVQMDRVEGGES